MADGPTVDFAPGDAHVVSRACEALLVSAARRVAAQGAPPHPASHNRLLRRVSGRVFEIFYVVDGAERPCAAVLRAAELADGVWADGATGDAYTGALEQSQVRVVATLRSGEARVDVLELSDAARPLQCLARAFAAENRDAALRPLRGPQAPHDGTADARFGRALAATYGQGGALERALCSATPRFEPAATFAGRVEALAAQLQAETCGGYFQDVFFSGADRAATKFDALQALQALADVLRGAAAGLEAPRCAGGLSVFSSVVDAHGTAVTVDEVAAPSGGGGACLFCDDAVGSALALVLGRCAAALSPHDAMRLPAHHLAAQLGCNMAEAAAAQAALAGDAAAPRAPAHALVQSLRDCEHVVADAHRIAAALVASVVQRRYDTPIIDAEVLKSLRTATMRHAATCYNEIVSRAHARVAEASFDGGEGLKPWASLVGMVESAVEAAARPAASATSRQTAVAAAFVATLARGARSALLLEAAAYAPGASTVSARWSRAPAAATVAARQPWDAAGFFADERLRYAAHAQILHGSIVDPVSGEALDILSQCVSLRIEARDVELVDAAAFDDVLAAFGDRLPLQQRCWVKGAPGSVHRVNGDATHDVSQQTGPAETLLRDVKRKDIVTEPLLVIGEPAGGKTTFAKQLLAWALREPRHARLVPVLVRVCDVARFFRAEAGGCADAACLVWEFLRRTTPEVRCKLYDAARAERRLLLVLDGLDEAGALHDRLEREVRDEYQHHPLVLTSRDMKALSSATFARFRRVRMLQLSRAQIYAVAERRLGTARADDFAAALRGSAALQRMAVNPLLLSITLAVFTKTDGTSAGAPAVATMNRGLVYSIAVDSMLGTLGDADAAAGNARLLLRRIAWLAHSADGGDGARDWDDALVDQALGQLYDDKLAELQAAAVAQCGGSAAEVWRSAAVCAAAAQQHRDGLGRDWLRTSAAAQRGRLPLLAWFSERGEDKYRFAHLTFQEFFCAEHAFLDFEAACEKGPDAVAQLCARLSALVLRGRGPAELFQRGWWQQVVQICCDVARSRGRRDVAQHLGAALLGLGGAGAGAVALEACVGERNAATLAALLGDTAGAARALSLTNGELGAAACALLRAERCFGAALGRVDLSGNLLDARAALSVAAALSAARCPLRTLDVGANRMCVGSARRPGFERETYHSGKQGGSARSKLYVDYMHAAWIPDLSGIEALVALALEMRATLTALDVRSNALTVDAGNLLAALLPEAGGASRLRELCGINVAALCGDGVADLAFGPDLDGVQPLLVGQKVEARFGGEEGRVFYPALVEAVVQGGAGGAAGPAAYDVAYIDETGGVIRREAAVPRCLVRDGARAGSRRLEAGGCLVLAAALERASPRARSRLRVLRLAHQGIAFDMSVWNHGQGEAGDVPLESGSAAGPSAVPDDDMMGINPAAGPLAVPDDAMTGINPVAALRLLAVLARCPNVRLVDVRDTLDAGPTVGRALAAVALRQGWAEVGVGGCVVDVYSVRAEAGAVRLRRSLKDAGVACVVELAQGATAMSISTTAVSSRGLEHLIRAALERPHLERINSLDLARFRDDSLRRLDLSGARLSRSLVRVALSYVRSPDRMPLLEGLDLSNADLMPSDHPHATTPELFGAGHLCNACATHHSLDVDLNVACQVCDNDSCGAAWRSKDIVYDLSEALLARRATLERLALANCCFTVMDGCISVEPFQRLGDALSKMEKLRSVDLSRNTWSCPRLTRWCAESLVGGDVQVDAVDDDDADVVRPQRNRRFWNRTEDASDTESDGDDGDADRAYSRTRLPVARGFGLLAAGLAKCATLETVRVADDDEVIVDVRTLVDRGVIDFGRLFPADGFDVATLLVVVEVTAALARQRRLHAADGAAPSPQSPRDGAQRLSLVVDLPSLPQLTFETAQRALAGLLAQSDLTIVDLHVAPGCHLDVARLESGELSVLDLGGGGSAPARAAAGSGAAAGGPIESSARASAADGLCCGLLVAAAIRRAKKLEQVDVRDLDFGESSGAVVAAVLERHGDWLTYFNGVALAVKAPQPTNLSFRGRALMDTGAFVVAQKLLHANLSSLDVAGCSLSPHGVAALVAALGRLRCALRDLNLARNDCGEAGTAAVAEYLGQNAQLQRLDMSNCRIPRSSTAAMDALGVALQVNSTLVRLDLRGSAVPARLARSLKRTFLEKRPTAPLALRCKLAAVACVRRSPRGAAVPDVALALVFVFSRTRRVLLLDARSPEALADLFAIHAPAARQLIDRIESGELEVDDEDDMDEINAAISMLDDNDQRSVTRAYWVQRTRNANLQAMHD